MNILGIAHDLWISSAALVRDGQVVAAVCEERLNRKKRFKSFPVQSVDFCLQQAGIRLDDLDLIVSGWNPVWHLQSLHPRFSATSRWSPEYLYAVPNYLLQMSVEFPTGPVTEIFGGLKAHIIHIDHQMAHAANAFYLSPFARAAVLTADGRGERVTALLARADAGGIEPLREVNYPHSLGLFYGLITQFLGFQPDGDEWKVMALASFGSGDRNAFYPMLRNMVQVNDQGQFRLDLNLCGYHQPDIFGNRFYSDDFVKAIGLPPRLPTEPIREEHKQLAWALQRVFEETMTQLLRYLHQATGLNQLVLAGGCMMNSAYNGRITSCTPFKDVYISSCPDDSGISVGAALWGYYQENRPAARPRHAHNYWGPDFDAEIAETLVKFKLPLHRLENAPETAARYLADGKLIGWFQGAMEFGQRALGNRSILADPRRAETKDLVNAAVKYRESFRPFAPAILAEKAREYFHTDGVDEVPFMERVFVFREEVKSRVPAVVHVDGTGRLQTVRKDTNPRFYELIEAFERLTGVPVVMNTSFNLNGEPIVCTPSDAIRTFYTCGLDALFIGDHLLVKA